MTPLQFETMWIIPLKEPRRLMLHRTHDIVHCVAICWAIMYHFKDSPFKPTDYYVQTIGLDGVI